MPRLNIVRVEKSFDGQKVLDDINLQTADGELVVVLGPSGCGKSTLLRLVAGLEEVDSGEIWIGTRRVDQLTPQKRNVSLVFQNYALYPHMTVEQNLAFPLKIAGENRKKIKDRVISAASMIGLADRLNARPVELSGGQRQRVALGRAIIRQPDIYLLDEPLSNLDADLRIKMRRELVQLQKSLGTTMIHVTHDQTEALTMADRLAVIEAGKIRQVGTVDDVYNRPADLFVASFIGAPKMNFMTGWITENSIKPFNLPIVHVPSDYNLEEVTVGIRPEDILIGPDGLFGGEVTAIEYLGNRSIVTFKYNDILLNTVTDSGKYDIGENIKFSVNAARCHVFHKESGVCLSS
jgi:ABC-type sugar transport system ATPase subunit